MKAGTAAIGFPCLDRLHVIVGKPEVMADFVDQHVGDHLFQGVLALAPIIQQGPAIEPDHVGQRADGRCRVALREAHAAEQAQYVELGLRVHLPQRFLVGKIDHANHEPLAQRAEFGRQGLEHAAADGVDIVEARRAGGAEIDHAQAPRGETNARRRNRSSLRMIAPVRSSAERRTARAPLGNSVSTRWNVS